MPHKTYYKTFPKAGKKTKVTYKKKRRYNSTNDIDFNNDEFDSMVKGRGGSRL